MSLNRPIRIVFSTAAALLMGVSLAHGQTALNPADDGPEIVRDADELRADLRPVDIDKDSADTALVFTNIASRPTRVRCVAFNGNGHPIGRAWLRIPALGLRFMLASDLVNGIDFVGHVQCAALVSVKPTAVFLAGGLTDLPTVQPSSLFGRIRFPLVASF